MGEVGVSGSRCAAGVVHRIVLACSESQDEQLSVSSAGAYQLLKVGGPVIVVLTGTFDPEDEGVRWIVSLSVLESG